MKVSIEVTIVPDDGDIPTSSATEVMTGADFSEREAVVENAAALARKALWDAYSEHERALQMTLQRRERDRITARIQRGG